MIYFVSFNKNENSNILQLKNKYSVIEFCKNHPNDIICYINKNSIIVNESDILNKYYKLKHPLIFSKEFTTIFDKYKSDKIELYEPCYIGTSKSIIDYYYGKYDIVYDTTIFHIEKDNTYNSSKSIVTYIPNKEISFLPEIILCLCFGIIITINKSFFSYFLCAFIALGFIEYQLKIKHYDYTLQTKIIYLLIDSFHLFIQFLLLFLIINFNCNVKKLILLNILYLTIVFLFFIFKSCILNILQNILSNENTSWNGIDIRLKYFFILNQPYVNNTIYNDAIGLNIWISGNKLFILALIALNAYFFVKCKI